MDGWRGGIQNRESDGGGGGASTRGVAVAGQDSGGHWNMIHAGSTGTGTSYRLLRRQGPAPGTTDGGARGLAQFRLEAVIEGVTAEQLARVQMDDLLRRRWDTSLMHADHLAVSSSSNSSDGNNNADADAAGDGGELAFWRMKFPMPLAPREYLFVRRRWGPASSGADDGA